MSSTYTVYRVALGSGKKFVGITVDMASRIKMDLADAALENPTTWQGVHIKEAGVSCGSAFRVVHVARDLKDAIDCQALAIRNFTDGSDRADWYRDMPRGYIEANDVRVEEERLDVIFYKCSGCRFMSTTISRVHAHTRHVASCTGQIALELHTHVMVPRATPTMADSTGVRENLESIMASRVPSGLSEVDDTYTIGLDERTDYLLSSPDVLGACFKQKGSRMHQDTNVDISLKLFEHLWGSKAPRRFQTVFTFNKIMYDLRAVGDSSDLTTVDIAVINDASDFNEFTIRVCEALDEIAMVVSERCGDTGIASVAKTYRVNMQGKSMSTLDVLTRSKKYDSNRKRDPARVKLANALKTAVRGVVKKTRLARDP